MRLLLDTDILIDILADRKFFVDDAKRIIQSTDIICISALSVRDTFLFAQDRDPSVSSETMENFVSFFEILPVPVKIIKAAFRSEIKDIEDAIQEQTAKANMIDFIITRDKHFLKSEVRSLSPKEYLEKKL